MEYKLDNVKTPCYIIDEVKLQSNLNLLKSIEDKTSCHILLAQKAFSMYSVYPLISQYLSGTTASGLYEARLSDEYFGKENHVFSPAYKLDELKSLLNICDHVIFNSTDQYRQFQELIQLHNQNLPHVSVGLRINPEFSTQQGHGIYDPCGKYSRLGSTTFTPDIGIEGIHFHTLCEQGAEDLVATFNAFEDKFGKYLFGLKWINLGGGHHITQEGYNIQLLCSLIERIKNTYSIEVYLEPGEAVVLNAGYLVGTVLDIVHNGMDIAILDTSAACHMPDVLEMPYTPHVVDAKEQNLLEFNYRLAGNTCLAGDIIGDYSFSNKLHAGSRLVFCDMALYTMVKNNTFNGTPLPSIAILRQSGSVEIVKEFSYLDFKQRL